MIHLSDLHLDMHPAMPHALIERVREVEYDVSALTGDFRGKTFGPYEPAGKPCNGCGRIYRAPSMASWATMMHQDGAGAMGIHCCEVVTIAPSDTTMCLAGIDDPHYYRAAIWKKPVSLFLLKQCRFCSPFPGNLPACRPCRVNMCCVDIHMEADLLAWRHTNSV
jgi:hypothetical protein